MRLSGRIDDETSVTDNPIPIGSTAGSLPSEHLALLEQAYAETMPEYAKLVQEYQNAYKRAETARCKSNFPDKAHWHPPGRQLTSDERFLLVGPENKVTYHKKVAVTDPATKRVVEYSTVTERGKSRVSCAYVRIQSRDTSCDSADPRFGSITFLFQHYFAGKHHFWAIVKSFLTLFKT